MSSTPEIVFVGTSAFIATNVDDLLIITVFFFRAKLEGLRRWPVVLGQYLGIGALVAVSFAGTAITGLLPGEWIGALGLIPIGLGIREWVRYRGQSAVPTPTELGRTATSIDSLFAVVATTIANGADNLDVYVPLFASADFQASLTIMVLFAVLIAGWCVLGQWLGAHPAISELLRRRAGLVVPLMLVGLGIYIVITNRTWALLF